jgi:sugar diacid utilization regulator
MAGGRHDGRSSALNGSLLATDRSNAAALAALLASLPDDVHSAADALATRAALLTGTPITVAAWAGHRWTSLAGPGTGIAGLPATGSCADIPHDYPGVIAARQGRVALCWDPATVLEAGWQDLLRQGCVWLSLLLDRSSAADEVAAAAAEAKAIGEVVQQLLSVHDLDLVLRTIAERTLRLLDADICGVMLREDEALRMRSCVGNRLAETGRITMRRGQGVAGLVFLTGELAKVDTYLDDETVPQDFASIAVGEEIRSALAVPLRLREEFIGVLEVWRRRTSIFTDSDVRQMVTLADFVTVAIDNARLHDEQVAAGAEAEQVRDALQRQMNILDRSSQLQHRMLSTVVEGGGLTAIARTIALYLECEVGVYGPNGELVASHSGDRIVGRLPPTMLAPSRKHRPQAEDARLWMRPVFADGDPVGHVVLVQEAHPAELMDAVVGHAGMACSLALLRERAASRARTEAIEQLLWDLLHGSVEHRLAARTRAQQLNVSLNGRLRVLHGRIENVEDLAAEHGWDTSQTDRLRRQVLRTVRTLEGRGLALASLRGDMVVAIAAEVDRGGAKDLVTAYSAAVHQEWPQLQMTWGISREHNEILDLPSALNEARTALAAARRLGGQDIFLYEELGIVRLLLGSGDDPDLLTFIEEVTGPLIAYDRENGGALIHTLRAFFDANCSQRVAAERLFVHHKTLRYRLERIRQLTGLDLSQHEDRMRADFALRLLQVNQSTSDDGEAATRDRP